MRWRRKGPKLCCTRITFYKDDWYRWRLEVYTERKTLRICSVFYLPFNKLDGEVCCNIMLCCAHDMPAITDRRPAQKESQLKFCSHAQLQFPSSSTVLVFLFDYILYANWYRTHNLGLSCHSVSDHCTFSKHISSSAHQSRILTQHCH